MSFKLLKVELINIRSHSHMLFEPEATGITAIQGANGTGKSSIVDSISWALYGTKPDGVSKSVEIFRNGLGDKDQALARVDFLVEGVHYRVERRRVNRQGTLECEVWSITEKDGEETKKNLAGPAVTHAEPFIRKLLRMDEKGFLASILVQQKQVDILISAGRAERGKVIEKLTGIAGITASLRQATQDHKALKKSVETSTIDETELRKLQREETNVSDQAEEKVEKATDLKAQAAKLKTEGSAIRTQLEEATEKYDKKKALENSISEIQTRIEVKTEALQEATRAKEADKAALAGDVGSSYEELEEKLQKLDSKRSKLSLRKSRAEDQISRLRAEEELLNTTLSESSDLDGTSIDDVTERKDELVRSRETITLGLGEARTREDSLRSAVEVIKHGDSCPTCLQTVPDPGPAVSALLKEADELKVTQDKLSTELQANGDETVSLEEKLSKLIAIDRASKRVDELAEEQTAARKELDDAASDLAVLERELKSVNKQFDQARNARERRKAYQRTLERAQTLTNDLEDLEFKLSKYQKEDSVLESASQRSINSLQRKLDEARGKHSSVSVEYAKVTGEWKVAEQRLTHLRSDIARHLKDIEKHKELLQSVAASAHSVELISEFRTDRIKNSIPVIEVYASDLLSRFTDGLFTRLTLDQKFNATVYLADGTPRSVGLLSGGELSAAAISLRLAVAMLLNSGADQNAVILDEVLVSQDGLRAELILSTIKEMFKGQVILIAHNADIDAIADHVVSLPTDKTA